MKSKKYLIFAFALLVVIFFISRFQPLGEVNTIIIDPGHGGDDGGCSYGNLLEKDINLDIATRLRDLLLEMDYNVELTRWDDTSLTPSERAELANSKGSELYISIHQNAADDTSASGIETWYSSKNPNSKGLAKAIQTSLIDSTSAKDRGARHTGKLTVVCKTKMPSVLIETGFLSNEAERTKLSQDDYRQLIAQSIADAIYDFCGEEK